MQSTELADRFLGQAVAEILLRRISGQVFERENREFDRCLSRALQPTSTAADIESDHDRGDRQQRRRDRDPRMSKHVITPRYPRRRTARDCFECGGYLRRPLITAGRILFQTAFDHGFQRRRH